MCIVSGDELHARQVDGTAILYSRYQRVGRLSM